MASSSAGVVVTVVGVVLEEWLNLMVLSDLMPSMLERVTSIRLSSPSSISVTVGILNNINVSVVVNDD